MPPSIRHLLLKDPSWDGNSDQALALAFITAADWLIGIINFEGGSPKDLFLVARHMPADAATLDIGRLRIASGVPDGDTGACFEHIDLPFLALNAACSSFPQAQRRERKIF